jgi:hypothetical protein
MARPDHPLPLGEAGLIELDGRNDRRASVEETAAVPPELMAEMKERAERAARGVIDRQARRMARERMDRIREEFRRRHGEVNLAVDLIREAPVDA